MDDSFWQRQESESPLFPDAIWNKPERRDLAGKLAIIGGNSHSFASVAAAYQSALKFGIGSVKIILPESLKKVLPATFTAQVTDIIFAPANHSGSFSKDALNDWQAAASWADVVLFIGDNSSNSETAALMEDFLSKDQNSSVVLTRDAVDLINNSSELVLNRDRTHLIVSFSQLQKLFKSVYYPKVLAFSQGVRQVAETLHKFTITYPVTISLWHADNLFVAKDGQVVTQEFSTPLRVWSGEVATRAAVWQVWQSDPLKSAATSWTEL